MSIKRHSLIAACVVLGLSSAATARQITTSGIRGQWRVFQTELADPDGVQAYSDEQLRVIVGSRLLIDRDSARWIITPSRRVKLQEHEGFFQACGHPVIKGLGDDLYEMRCSGRKVFAPGLTLMGDGGLVISWWDGVDIYLRKEP